MTIIKVKNNVRALVVEDAEFRHDWFRKKLPGCIIASEPEDAIARFIIAENLLPFDIVFLDHDLRVDLAGNRFMVSAEDPDYEKDTYWRVAQLLKGQNFKGTVIIHSGNPVGAKRMADLLSDLDVYILPFGSFDIQRQGVKE